MSNTVKLNCDKFDICEYVENSLKEDVELLYKASLIVNEKNIDIIIYKMSEIYFKICTDTIDYDNNSVYTIIEFKSIEFILLELLSRINKNKTQ